MTLHVIELARVTPAADSDFDSVLNSANSLAIPLTFFDLPWLVFPPVKRVFFYGLTESTHEHFNSFILPKLKLSLSLVLRRSYLPLTGRIVWDPNQPKPNIIVSQNDTVSVTIAESDADFSLLSGYGQRPVTELHSLLPELPVSDDSATAFSLQITFFPNNGFSIGVAAHHAVLDGKTSSMFVRAWAHLCKQHIEENRVVSSLPETPTPSLDRSLIKDPTGLDEQMIEIVTSLKHNKTGGRISLRPIPAQEPTHDVVLTTLVLSRVDVERLRERVKSDSRTRDKNLHLSTFVIAYAYVWTCLVKARGGSGERRVCFLFSGDFRERLDPPLPATYFGNCVFPAGSYNRKAADFEGEEGFVTAVEILSELVKGLSSRKIETIAEEFKIGFDSIGVASQFGTVAGSTRLGVYDSDFGWGRPVKVDVVSIDGERISMAERRDEPGGVEIGICMKKSDIDVVLTLFNNGLQN
ncbi:unnamed protein product [Brassica oleracea var. botrytis]|uniref:Uncharacterized protein n=3 Tax=Brassica TaxID=3705 RepID=A0A0D3APM6_BRAOL|nr:PREDICTED: phenolic glucoside malonyltransferase 2-like [Brassica oleracea var. oleracea]XP_013699211.2 phenolic glucoside malonyltransferase 2-like [Brassica napus]CAF1907468.1 unnamed protein product [Brassica napus]CDY09445.1 BnaC02g19870D [Brassica napus]VDD22644.1 unnamed protein product [Brassica oleracea]